jgi:hypothetical protein
MLFSSQLIIRPLSTATLCFYFSFLVSPVATSRQRSDCDHIFILLYFSIMLHYHKMSSFSNVVTVSACNNIYCFSFLHSPLHASAFYTDIFRWAHFSCSLLHLYAEPHVRCFVIPNKICPGVHKIRKIC